jgi:hypothetical protein
MKKKKKIDKADKTIDLPNPYLHPFFFFRSLLLFL